MTDAAAIRIEAARLTAAFEAAGAARVETDILQPADTLLDLYGEDMRARAFVSADPIRGEVMLRPDFTVPVVEWHLAIGAGPARYTYEGKVFRQQSTGSDRPAEYVQVGIEDFGATDCAAADADILALISGLLAPLGLRVSTGDMGLLRAAIAGLDTSEVRRAALMRHLWRPHRFRALMERYSGPVPPVPAPPAAEIPEIGLRSRAEVEARIARLAEDAETPPIPAPQAEAMQALLQLKATGRDALSALREIAVDLPAMGAAVEAFAARLDALATRGIDPATLPFEASYGRTTLEYYDGFVFGLYAEGRPDLPPVGSGGRYDALTRALGGPDAPAAVGGVIRPGLVVDLGGAP